MIRRLPTAWKWMLLSADPAFDEAGLHHFIDSLRAEIERTGMIRTGYLHEGRYDFNFDYGRAGHRPTMTAIEIRKDRAASEQRRLERLKARGENNSVP